MLDNSTLRAYGEVGVPLAEDAGFWLYGGGLCQKTCSLTKANDCRGHSADLIGDYECRAWNKIQATSGNSTNSVNQPNVQ